MNILVTGSAGFIGFHTVEKLASSGHDIVGLDHINDYYDIGLKYDRLMEAGFDRKAVDESSAPDIRNGAARPPTLRQVSPRISCLTSAITARWH